MRRRAACWRGEKARTSSIASSIVNCTRHSFASQGEEKEGRLNLSLEGPKLAHRTRRRDRGQGSHEQDQARAHPHLPHLYGPCFRANLVQRAIKGRCAGEERAVSRPPASPVPSPHQRQSHG